MQYREWPKIRWCVFVNYAALQQRYRGLLLQTSPEVGLAAIMDTKKPKRLVKAAKHVANKNTILFIGGAFAPSSPHCKVRANRLHPSCLPLAITLTPLDSVDSVHTYYIVLRLTYSIVIQICKPSRIDHDCSQSPAQRITIEVAFNTAPGPGLQNARSPRFIARWLDTMSICRRVRI
jgi:hypothetical protein